MKLIEQKAELWKQGESIEDMWNHIAKCTRVCYQSIPKNEDGKNFCERTILVNKHYGMLEHGTVYLIVPSLAPRAKEIKKRYDENPYSRTFTFETLSGNPSAYYITTNYRVILENNWEKDLDYWSTETEYHHKRITFSLITSIGIARELCRHRCFSFAQESTRYVNYGKNEHMEFIIPSSINLNKGIYYFDGQGNICGDGYIEEYKSETIETTFLGFLDEVQDTYASLLKKGLKPQEAREVLPLCLKTQLIMTGFEDDWNDFLMKRYYEFTGKVHPDMKVLAEKIFDTIKQ